MDLFTGTQRFEIRKALGQRERSLVYEAFDRAHETRVALKLLPDQQPEDLERSRREFENWRRAEHPNLVRLEELVIDANKVFFTMELVRGQPLLAYVRAGAHVGEDAAGLAFAQTEAWVAETVAEPGRRPAQNAMRAPASPTAPGDARAGHRTELLEKPGFGTLDASAPLPAESWSSHELRVRESFAQLAHALHALHLAGGLHRQLEPESVLIAERGRVVVLAPLFGYTLATQPTGKAMPPYYLAPEQIREHALGPAADWYSMGAILYEALTGQRAFQGLGHEVLLAKMAAPPDARAVASDCPEDLAELCRTLLEPDPGRRPNGAHVTQILGPDLPRYWHALSARDADGHGPVSELRSVHGETLAAGTRVGASYVVDRLVSEGGFASVYRGHDVHSGRAVAIKVLRHDLALSERMLERFRQEAMVAGRLRHPGIVELLELGSLDARGSRPYLTMEWLDGQDLHDHLAAHGPFTAREALAIMEQVCAGLSCAHEAGVVHRDLKSHNIMLVRDGDRLSAKLVDFGIAKLTAPEDQDSAMTTRTFIGTPVTMAPEQILREPVDQRTDIYALGVVLYEMVCGQVPFYSRDFVEIEQMHLSAQPPRASERAQVGAAFDAVVARAMAKDKHDRHDDVHAFLADLMRAVDGGRTDDERVTERGLGISIEARARAGEDEDDDEILDHIDALLERARDFFDERDIQVVLESGDSLFGVALAARDANRDDARVPLLAALLEAYGAWTELAPDVDVLITVHSGEVTLARQENGRVELAGGDLLHLGRWPDRPEIRSGVLMSTAVLSDAERQAAPFCLSALPDGSSFYRLES